jgi:hypothetical protein
MERPLFDEAGFLEAARILASEHGPVLPLIPSHSA